MKSFSFLPVIVALTLIFSGCMNANTTSITQENTNPLTATRYGDELADSLANLIIQNNPIVEKEGIKDRIQKEIEDAKKISQDANKRLSGAMMGPLLAMQMDAVGYIAYVRDTLFLSSDFYSKPGPNLHVYLTTVVDPRDVEFPDPSAIDLGVIQSPYGAQQYQVPSQDDPTMLRTFVLWDQGLNLLYSFAQLSVRP